MKTICLYFEIHQNIHLKRYRFFDIGTDHYYYDDYENERSISETAEKSYVPALEALIDMAEKNKHYFKCAISLSGCAIEQLENHAPQVIDLLQKLYATGCCEILAEPYSHGLSSLANHESFCDEVKRLCRKVHSMFGATPKIFRNSCLIYSDEIGELVAGMGFKISLVPFHLWTADVYEGAPSTVTAYLSVISKGSAAFVLMAVLVKVFAPMVEQWQTLLYWVIIASITLANLFALRQQNLKRLMAFSSISQAGYIMLGVIAGTAQGLTALVYYILSYLFAHLGVFAVIPIIALRTHTYTVDDYNGLYTTNPRLAFLMTLCLFSLAGIPPFAGFFSKFFIFAAAFNSGFHLLVFIALANTVNSLYYYLRVVKAMYINKNEEPIAAFSSDNYTRAALLICTLGITVLSIVSASYESIGRYAFGL